MVLKPRLRPRQKAPAASTTLKGSGDGLAGKARKHYSRNKKKNMRTKIDMTTVDDALEDRRHEERSGGPLTNKADQQLFFMDVDAKKSPAPSVPALITSAHGQPSGRKARAAAKTLTTYAMLESTSAVQPVGSRVQRTIPSQPRTLSKRKRVGEVHPREYHDPEPAAAPEWADGKEPRPAAAADPWLGHLYPERRKPQAEMMIPEASATVAIAAPSGGVSYHPTDTAHQKLLQAAHDKEQRRLAQEAAIRKRLPANLSAAAREEMWLREMAPDDDEEEEGEEMERLICPGSEAGSEAAGVLVKPVRAENRKTQQQRLTEARIKAETEARKAAKLERIRENEVFRLRSLKKELTAQENEREQRLSRRQAQEQQKRLNHPRKLSSQKFQEPDPELILTAELPGNLRELKPEGNLFRDRVISLQKRNMIEARAPTRLRRKYPRKVFEKRSYKNYDEQEVIRQRQIAARAAKK